MADRKLSNKKLGKKGEKRFEELCADAELTCNGSSEDEVGTDFYVDFPQAHQPGRTLDQRASPVSAHFQIKTRWLDTARVSMRLSAADRLAKEVKPAFVVVFDVAEGLSFVKGWLIHVADAFLALILRRLREAARDGVAAVNKKTVTFDPAAHGVPFDVTGAGLRTAVEAAVGDDLPAYVAAKAATLDTVGYDEDRILLSTTLMFEDESEVIDAFLGLRSIEARNVTAVETRFGIALPLESMSHEGSSQLAFSVAEPRTCKIVVKNGLAGPPAAIEGQILGPPGHLLSKASWKFRVITGFFDLILMPGRFTWTSHPDAFTKTAPLRALWSLAKLLEASASADATFEIQLDAGGAVDASPALGELSDEMRARFVEYGRMLDAARRVFDHLGLADFETSFLAVLEAFPRIRLLDVWLNEPGTQSSMSFNMTPTDAWDDAPPPPMLIVHMLELFGLKVGITAVGDMSVVRRGAELQLTSKSLAPVGIRVLDNLGPDMERFIALAKTKSGITDWIVHTYEGAAPPPAGAQLA